MVPQVNKVICCKLFFISAETVVWEQKIFKGRGQYEKHRDENKFFQA